MLLGQLVRATLRESNEPLARPSPEALEAYALGTATENQIEEVWAALEVSHEFRWELLGLMEDIASLTDGAHSSIELPFLVPTEARADSTELDIAIEMLVGGLRLVGASPIAIARAADLNENELWLESSSRLQSGRLSSFSFSDGSSLDLSINKETNVIRFQPGGSRKGLASSLGFLGIDASSPVDVGRQQSDGAIEVPAKVILSSRGARLSSHVAADETRVGEIGISNSDTPKWSDSIRARLPEHLRLESLIARERFTTVCKVYNERLGAHWVVKLLNAEASTKPDMSQRLLDEARIVAKIRHPNVVTVHDVDVNNGLIVMDFVDGQDLYEKCRTGISTWDEFRAITEDILAGLAAAHSVEVVHGDISPGNVIIERSGVSKIVDFGYAQHIDFDDTRHVGTIGYAAPERVNRRDRSPRSDVYSIGALLYHLATGELPLNFKSGSVDSYKSVVSQQTPKRPRFKFATQPPELESFLMKALSAEPKNRFESAVDMKEAFETIATRDSSARLQLTRPENTRSHRRAWPWIAGATATAAALVILSVLLSKDGIPQHPRIALIPFLERSGTDSLSIADGLTEGIATKLGKLSGITVIDRTSAVPYKDSKLSPQEIAQELDVDCLIKGSISWDKIGESDQVRITPVVVLASTGAEIWSQQFDAPFSTAHTTQTEIAEKIVEALGLVLSDAERAKLSTTLTRSQTAAAFLTQASDYFYRGDSDRDLKPAIQLYRRALQEDPECAAAFAGISRSFAKRHFWGFDTIADLDDSAIVYARQAQAVDSNMPEVRIAIGDINYRISRDYDSALTEYNRTLAGNPNSCDAHLGIAYVFRRKGDTANCLEHLHKALELNPKFNEILIELGNTHLSLGRWADARRYLSQAIDAKPDVYKPYGYLATLELLSTGNVSAAFETLENARELTKSSEIVHEAVWLSQFGGEIEPILLEMASFKGYRDDSLLYTGKLLRRLGRKAEADVFFAAASKELELVLVEDSTDLSILAHLAYAYGQLGQPAEAKRVSERALRLMDTTSKRFDWFRGPDIWVKLAEVYARLGNASESCMLLKRVERSPFRLISRTYLELSPEFAPIRDSICFKELVQRLPGNH